MKLCLSPHTLVDRHFARESSAREDQQMWRHLAGCDRCRARYGNHSMLERLDHGPTQALTETRERLGKYLFAGVPWYRSAKQLRLVAVVALSCAFAAVLITPTFRARDPFQTRGAPSASESVDAPSVALFQLLEKKPAERVGSLLAHDAALAIAYRNPGVRPFRYLLVFARDASGRIYWFAPLWRAENEHPKALPIEAGPAQHELPTAVRHALPAGELQLFALFARRSFEPREVEDKLAADRDALRKLPDTHLEERRLQVEP